MFALFFFLSQCMQEMLTFLSVFHCSGLREGTDETDQIVVRLAISCLHRASHSPILLVLLQRDFK